MKSWTTAMFDKGQVVRSHYLWHRQALEGEETGRKARPVCVVVRTAGNPGVASCFRLPRKGRGTSASSCRSVRSNAAAPVSISPAGLSSTSIIVVELDKAFDFDSTRPLGSFSPAFLKKIALTVKDAAAARRLTGVLRS